jgi:dihydrofolate reductase
MTRKILVSEFVTLDGVMEEPRWTFDYMGDHMNNKTDELFASDALLLGRVTYEGFAAAWPTMERDPVGFADRMNGIRKYVVSTTLDEAKWNNSKIIKKNVAEEISRLKNEDGNGNLLVYGSRILTNSLARQNLVDEYWFMVYPIVLGKGKRLFEDGTSVANLKLIDAKSYNSGVVLLRYRVEKSNGASMP